MKINLDYKLVLPENYKEKVPSNQELTFDYIATAVNQKYEKGMEGGVRRMWGRIQRKFDEAIFAKADTIELDEAEKDFISKTVEQAKFSPLTARYIQVLENEIDTWG